MRVGWVGQGSVKRGIVMKKHIGLLSLLVVVVFAGIILQGCSNRRNCSPCSSHSYCNPDGSTSYYRHYPGYTRECESRTVYHPSTHYYHNHY